MSMIFFLDIVSKKKKIVDFLEFDLTTLGFNVQNTLVPSRTLNRVPTVHVLVTDNSHLPVRIWELSLSR